MPLIHDNLSPGSVADSDVTFASLTGIRSRLWPPALLRVRVTLRQPSFSRRLPNVLMRSVFSSVFFFHVCALPLKKFGKDVLKGL